MNFKLLIPLISIVKYYRSKEINFKSQSYLTILQNVESMPPEPHFNPTPQSLESGTIPYTVGMRMENDRER